MSRRQAREMALQTLFQLDFDADTTPLAALTIVINEHDKVSGNACEYARELVEGVSTHLASIDEVIMNSAYDWKVERMPGVDRNILRVAIFELNFATASLSAGVVINEAVELSKLYGTEETPRFVNGLLGNLAKGKVEP